jgi:hypothetical protein
MNSNAFHTRTNVVYPPNNTKIFEEYFLDNFDRSLIKTEYEYLDILWTNFYISRNYGNSDISDLQRFIDGLDRSKRYFTIVQYDDCILNNLSDLDILIFSQGGHGNVKRDLQYPIPLNCMGDGNYQKNKDRDVLASFIGAIKGRHPVRERMKDLMGNAKDVVIKDSLEFNNPFLSGYTEFKDLLERSVFTLCPRGYGLTSFRICESLQHGSIPVYIYDDPWIPFNDILDFDKIGISIHSDKIGDLERILRDKGEDDINNYLAHGEIAYKEYFSFEGCREKIIKIINSR